MRKILCKDYKTVTGLYEKDMPSDRQIENPKKLTIDQTMAGDHIGMQWVTYTEVSGHAVPSFLVIDYTGEAQPFYIDGFKNAKRCIEKADKHIKDNPDDYPDLADWVLKAEDIC